MSSKYGTISRPLSETRSSVISNLDNNSLRFGEILHAIQSTFTTYATALVSTKWESRGTRWRCAVDANCTGLECFDDTDSTVDISGEHRGIQSEFAVVG